MTTDVYRSIQGILTAAGLSDSTAAECANKIAALFLPAQIEPVKTAIASLSFSELTLILAIFTEFETSERIVVAAKVAEKVGVPKTTAANALRKLEGAGMVETRSLGVKGMYIKVINNGFLNELKKFN